MVTVKINKETTFIIDRAISFILLYKKDFEADIWERAESVKRKIDLTTDATSTHFKLEQSDYDNIKFCIRTAIVYALQIGETPANYKIGIYGFHFLNDKYLVKNAI